ncbi:anion permease [Bordetella petrii]|uniref:Uncharacterized protein n=1 Tax=Bordetella petrii (strain ATCC BAA-461 / DSM 12804 / CCUG 43448 / CIP 107267 / Se-1111R) TaxID=340100 RepID=A9IDJ4_BORPD|nr:anion permease [Bordetella petrii]CAP44850.1 hypothetical protein predicted by Glimmer/Critica [Bordetella petrii]
MHIDWQLVLSWLSTAIAGGWFASWLALRKDERAVQIEQVTKERAKWRDSIRVFAEATATAWEEHQVAPNPAKTAALRARLATSINPKDDEQDAKILSHFDDLFSGKDENLALFGRRLALLLKHDWERVKWECTPLYIKPFVRYTKKQRLWRDSKYRDA